MFYNRARSLYLEYALLNLHAHCAGLCMQQAAFFSRFNAELTVIVIISRDERPVVLAGDNFVHFILGNISLEHGIEEGLMSMT